ncbi:hypothetical protein F4781DRAFT_411154 [Annulohypoxylon bovei var. microspora]|nr:hypothetical protein F4781DRAFT_411154 [Annulohypoxylon bovei var. microspora]
MATCGSCGDEFSSHQKRERHMNAWGHSMPLHECDSCFLFYDSRDEVVSHMNRVNHWFYKCNSCRESFPDEQYLRNHEVVGHYYCYPCNRNFNSYNNIKMHLNSRVHRGRNLECPFCKQAYTTATGLTHHMESGFCPKATNLNRDVVYRIIRANDPTNLISKKLLDGPVSRRYEATALAWNGHSYECYLCHRKFQQITSLNQHLGSAAHQQNLYHCPNRIVCGREFSTLAALMNHLESESCGYTKFENVQRSAKNITNLNRLIGFG